MKKAFTLAEIMIVLTVIAVLAAVILPVARNMIPNDDIVRFKKIDNAFRTAIRELVASEQFYLGGNFSQTPDGSTPDCCYHANALANFLRGEVISCDSGRIPSGKCYNTNESIEKFLNSDVQEAADQLDISFLNHIYNVIGRNYCNNTIKLQDGTSILYSPISTLDLSCKNDVGFDANYGSAIILLSEYGLDINNDGNTNVADLNTYYRLYNDDPTLNIEAEKAETFSYSIRSDGYIINTNKVDEWLKKSVNDKN